MPVFNEKFWTLILQKTCPIQGLYSKPVWISTFVSNLRYNWGNNTSSNQLSVILFTNLLFGSECDTSYREPICFGRPTKKHCNMQFLFRKTNIFAIPVWIPLLFDCFFENASLKLWYYYISSLSETSLENEPGLNKMFISKLPPELISLINIKNRRVLKMVQNCEFLTPSHSRDKSDSYKKFLFPL